MPISIAAICRYPVKGLSPEHLERVTLTPGESLPQDRRFAVAHASTRFDPEHPEWLPKTNFVMLMRDGHVHMGVYAEVVAGGETVKGDAVVPLQAHRAKGVGPCG